MDIRASAIIKIGGSLLGLPGLPARLADFLRDFSRPRSILVCGGGEAVELLRKWDRIYNIGEEESHWIALRMLSSTSRVLAHMLPELLALASSPEDCVTAWSSLRVPVYDPFHFIADTDEASRDPLPRRWRVTSDSIAARMARHFKAPELVLLKSREFPERISTIEAAREGLVDLHFPIVAREIERVVVINLRSSARHERELFDDDSAATTEIRPDGAEDDDGGSDAEE